MAADSPTPGTEARLCEGECGCRYGTGDPDRLDCACDGPCCNADDAVWFAAPSPVDTTEPPAETVITGVTGAGLMRNRCAFTSRDMAADWPEAFTYAVVLGWGDGREDEDDAWTSMAAKFGWDAELLAFLYDAHRRFSGLADRADRAALAARPSADTEKLRRVRELTDEYFGLCTNWARPMDGPSVLLRIRAALDGER